MNRAQDKVTTLKKFTEWRIISNVVTKQEF